MQDIWQKRLNKTKCRAAQIHKHSRAAWIWHVGCTSRLQEFPLSDTRPLHKGRFLANCYTIPVEFMQPQNIAALCVCVCVFFSPPLLFDNKPLNDISCSESGAKPLPPYCLSGLWLLRIRTGWLRGWLFIFHCAVTGQGVGRCAQGHFARSNTPLQSTFVSLSIQLLKQMRGQSGYCIYCHLSVVMAH